MACNHSQELTDDELADVMEGVLKGRPEGVTEDELKRVADWVHSVRVSCALVDMLLAGKLTCRLDEGEAAPTWWRLGEAA